MAQNQIERDLSRIIAEIKGIDYAIKDANADLSKTQNYLQYNPKSIENINLKYQQMAKVIEETKNKLAKLNEKQFELNNLFAKTDKQKYNDKMVSNQRAIDNTTKALNKLIDASKEENKQQEISNAKKLISRDRLNELRMNYIAFASTIEKVVKATVSFIKQLVDLGNEMYDTAKKLNTSVESLQLGRNIYEKLAGGADEYDAALSALSNTMALIARGSGARYQKTLKAIGLTTKDLQGLSTGQQLEIITKALGNVENEATRTQYALDLLGQAGRSVAVIAGEDSSILDSYNKALIENGIITTEEAKTADKLAQSFDSLKKKFQSVALQLLVGLEPAINSIVRLIEELQPVLKIIFDLIEDIFGSDDFIEYLEIVKELVQDLTPTLKIISKLLVNTIMPILRQNINLVKYLFEVLKPVLLILNSVLWVINKIAEGINWLSSTISKAIGKTNSLKNNLIGLNDVYSNMNNALNLNTNSISQTSTSSNLNISMDLYGHGDTQISDNSAIAVALNLGDIINQQLGALI